MRLERVWNVNESMQEVEPDSIGYKIMREKTQILAFKIANLKLQAMQILKQDALSNGAELVTPKDAILCKKESYDCLLFGTPKSLKILITKMQMQPFGLKKIAQDLAHFLHAPTHFGKKVMGIINVDSQSFYQEYNSKEAIEKMYEYLRLGVDVIDIGAASTRPGAPIIESTQELARLQPILHEIQSQKIAATISIDTYNAAVAQKALECGCSMINDVSGKPENMLKVLQEHPQASYILTHTRGTPETMQEQCHYENIILEIDSFFTQKLAYLQEHTQNTIILDVGIGFAKNMQQNMVLLSQLSHFRHFNLPLLIGASRKSFLTKILEQTPSGQQILSMNDNKKAGLSATLTAHLLAWQHGANIVRVHDVKEHIEMLRIMDYFHAEDMDTL